MLVRAEDARVGVADRTAAGEDRGGGVRRGGMRLKPRLELRERLAGDHPRGGCGRAREARRARASAGGRRACRRGGCGGSRGWNYGNASPETIRAVDVGVRARLVALVPRRWLGRRSVVEADRPAIVHPARATRAAARPTGSPPRG